MKGLFENTFVWSLYFLSPCRYIDFKLKEEKMENENPCLRHTEMDS